MKIHFLGAAETVTGSCYLIEACGKRFLVDCGLFQGTQTVEKLNREDFPFDSASIDFAILTHAHLDHCGRLPLLAKNGFKNRIYCTRPTSSLASIMLKDSAFIQEEENRLKNKSHADSGLKPDEPLYTVSDAENIITYLYTVDYDTLINPADDISFTFRDAGHLLGSAYVELEIFENGKLKNLTFSGDLGSGNSLILDDSSIPNYSGHVIIESTYGDSNHTGVEKRAECLAREIENTYKNSGITLIPSFSVGRTQEVVFELFDYFEKNDRMSDFLKLPIYVDSPLSTEATKIYSSHASFLSDNIRKKIESGHNPLYSKNIKYVSSHKESQSLAFDRKPKVVISASGMCDGGRVRLHLANNLPVYKSKIIIVGFQAEETFGRLLLSNPRSVNIHGKDVEVNARIVSIDGFSGHADLSKLSEWLKYIDNADESSNIENIILCHGEKDRLHSFKDHITSNVIKGADVAVPSLRDFIEI